MSQTFENKNINGIFNMGELNFIPVDEIGSTINLEMTVSEAKDPLFIVVDLRACTSSLYVNVLNTQGEVMAKIPTIKNRVNVLPVTTFGCVDKDRKMKLQLDSNGGTISPDFNIGIGSFSHVPVINH